jgi:NADH pyrophosphatase NudC (nudix superfamily)
LVLRSRAQTIVLAVARLLAPLREIESARWFDRDGLPDLPPKLSLTRALIDDWVAGT